VWARLWKLPQAVEWQRLGQEHLVALYVRRFVEAEAPDTTAALSTLVRQFADSLGLTVPGMRSNRWVIDQGGVPAPRQPKQPAVSARDRLRIVDRAPGEP